jgi:DNA-binding transcriptional regulator YhcF (GntR family)
MDMKSNIPKDHIGIFRDTLRKHGSKVNYYYYATEKGQLPLRNETRWYENITEAKELLEKVITRAQSNLTTISLSNGLQSKKRKLVPPPNESGLKPSEALALENKSLFSTIDNVLTSSSDCHRPPTKLDYFDSPEARLLFAMPEDESTRQSINVQIGILQAANDGDKGYISVLDGGEEIDEDTLTERFKHNLRQKCQILTLALQLALEQMNGWTWTKCCEMSVKVANRMGISITKNADTVKRWYRHFREKRKFIVSVRQKHNLPPFLELNPDVCSAIKKYACSNLNRLSVEAVVEYIHHTVLPQIARNEMEENNNLHIGEEEMKKIILQCYGLTKLCPSTVYKWMKQLGFKYEPQRKGYYVDGHEKPATIAYRKDFVQRYLTEEVQMFRWIQITEEEAVRLEEMGVIKPNAGYRYNQPLTGLPMREYHVDTCDLFQERMNREEKFGGRPSVRRDQTKKMIIKIGHDEAIVKQFTLSKKSWYGPNGEAALLPKEEGLGIMLSGLMSREFGWGFPMSPEELVMVNQKRLNENYLDAQSAIEKRGNAAKPPLTTSPFVLEFEYGINAQGYWSYEHMVMQLEDCIDCLTVLYPNIDFVFLLDHSCGHDRQREDGLNVAKMSKSFWG